MVTRREHETEGLTENELCPHGVVRACLCCYPCPACYEENTVEVCSVGFPTMGSYRVNKQQIDFEMEISRWR